MLRGHKVVMAHGAPGVAVQRTRNVGLVLVLYITRPVATCHLVNTRGLRPRGTKKDLS